MSQISLESVYNEPMRFHIWFKSVHPTLRTSQEKAGEEICSIINNLSADSGILLKLVQSLITWQPVHYKRLRSKG